MKSIFYPNKEDIINWTKGDLKWPSQDWEAYVMDANCDDLIMKFANIDNPIDDREDYLRRFFIYSLYYFVGNHYRFSRNYKPSIDRLDTILKMVDDNSSMLLVEWKTMTIKLLNNEVVYDNDFWFYNSILEE